MVELVSEESYFHINSNANLSPHDLMRMGSIIEIGQQTNPFFRLYETWQRTYDVTNVDTKEVLRVPSIRFLRCVKEGSVTTDALPTIAHDVANHFLMLARELFWENVRLAE